MAAVKTILLMLLLAPSLLAGPIILVANKKGNTFEAELLSATKATATVRRSSDKKLFSLKLDTLNEDCVKTIEKHRPNLEAPYPTYETEVVVGKRRKKGDSYYMVTQTITASAKITNTDREISSPEISGRVVFLGQDQRDPDQFEVLATRDFKVSPEPGSTIKVEFRPFSTSYDSDNEGSGNIGGHQYDGYVLILYKNDNTVAHSYTTNSRYRKAFEADIGILDSFRTIKAGSDLTKGLKPPGRRGKGGGDVINVGD